MTSIHSFLVVGFLILLCVLLTNAPLVDGFMFDIFQPMSVKPDLLQLTDKQSEKLLSIHLHVGDEEGPRMAVTDLMIELHHETADYEHTTLPGADGQHHKLSSGHRRLEVITNGHFVNLMGTQHVAMQKGCWEMCWRKDKPAGTLICGFELPEEYRRNDAVLPKGEVYISFPLWTREGLKLGQQEKHKVEVRLESYLKERDEALQAFDATDNLIMKAIHIRNAFAATDKYNAVDHHTLETIPMDHQVFPIQDDLLLTVKGLLWTKDSEHRGSHVLLGHANVALASQKSISCLMP